MRFSARLIEHQIHLILSAWGLPPDAADTAAAAILDADLAGIDSHGISMLPTYEQLRTSGTLVLDRRPTLERETEGTAVLDADGGLGHPVAVMAMGMACDRAEANGVGAVCVRNSHHFGATGYYASLAAARGLIGLVTTSARTVCVTPTRGRVPRLATNPIAFAAPARRNGPLVIDMSTSTVAVNKIKVYGYTDKQLPAGWVLDGDGSPVRDPREAMRLLRGGEAGGLTPLGGSPAMSSHKGYALSLMVQVLSATLCGAAFAALREPGAPEDIGHFFLALSPTAFREPGGFEEDMDMLIDTLRATPPVDSELPVLVPGDPEALSRRQREIDGVPVPATLHEQLRGVCTRAGVPFVLERHGSMAD
jgi:LDH2 family malate/lactate/ureidoglycolate dehydrogenase